MPSKKSNKGKKSAIAEPKFGNSDEAFEKLLQDESVKANNQTESPKKPQLKCSQWTQESNWLDISLFVGEKIRSEDIRDFKYTDQSCELRLLDGREWNMHFYKPIEMTKCRIQLKGMRIQLRVKKKTPGNWLDIQFIPGQSDKLSPAKKKRSVESNPKETSCAVSALLDEGSSQEAGVSRQGSGGEKDERNGLREEREENTPDTESLTVVEQKPDLSDLVEDEPPTAGQQQQEQEQGQQKVEQGFVYNLLHVKSDFYEKTVLKSNDTVSVQMFVKHIVRDSLQVLFEGRHVSVRFRTTNKAFLDLHEGTDESTIFCWAIEVVAALLESQCKYKLSDNFLELTLRKVVAERWCALEAMHTRGKVQSSSDWKPTSETKSTATVTPSNAPSTQVANTDTNCLFDEMDTTQAGERKAAASKTSVLTESGRGNVQKPTCMVSPLKPPKERQVITPGYTGLDNLGNTCFMNSVLQVLANTTELKHYFLDSHFEREINLDNPLGSQGKLAGEFGQLMQRLWSGTKFSYAPTNLKKLIAQKKSMFSGFAQHDAQEYMSYLLDGLHEDVNRVKKKPYIEQVDSGDRRDEEVADESWENHKKRNDSFLVDLFQGQFKSKLVCPVCQKVSVTFDPFMHLPVPLPKKQKVLPVTFMSRDPRRKPLRLLVKIGKSATTEVLKQAVAERTGVHAKNLRVFEVYNNKVHRVFERRDTLNHVTVSDRIIVHEVLCPDIAGEPVKELIVIQRLLISRNKPSRCACCGKDSKVGTSLLRCTGCYRVGYCDIKCQKDDWHQRHRLNCRSQPDNVGTPFLVSLPQSQATYARLSQTADMYSRYSVNVFQPPQSDQPSSPSSPDPPAALGNTSVMETDSVLSGETDVTHGTQEGAQTHEASATAPSVCSTETRDSGQGVSVAMETEEGGGMSSSVSSQDTESWSVGEQSGEQSGQGSMSVSTSSTSLSADLEDVQSEEEKGESDRPVKQTRLVLGRQQDAERPAPQFRLCVCDKDGLSARGGGGRLEDAGEEALPLEGVTYLAMEWKNSEKLRPCVQVDSKELIHTVDPSVNTMISEENKDITLDQCLSLFTEPETLSAEEAWYCPGCKEHREASKQMSLWRLPNILIVQLKRFSYRNLLWCDKVDKMVDFPATDLDLSGYCSAHGCAPSDPPPVYDLYGVVNHYGGILGGHYTSHVRCVNREGLRNDTGWRLCDDSHVTKSSENQVVTRAAYVLFYRRRGMYLPLPEACPPPRPSLQTDELQDGEEEETSARPVFTISPDPEHDAEEAKTDTSRIFNTDLIFSRQRPRSFSFSEGETRTQERGRGDSFLDKLDLSQSHSQQQQPSCTDMDSVD